MAEKDPMAHDQAIMGRLLMLAMVMIETGKDSIKFSDTPEMTKPPYFGYYNSFEIVAGERPFPTKNTIAIHTLCNGPLKKPWGKKIMAKELGAWTGTSGYYSRTGKNRRYLWMDGHDSPSTYNTIQSFEWGMMVESFLVNDFSSLKWTMAVLLALSRRTQRIFVMPKILAQHGMHYLWTVMDFEPVDEMGIGYRETNFPHNKKAWSSEQDPFPTAARTALAPLEDADKERTMYVQYPSKNHVDDGIVKAWKFNENTTDEKALDAWWALHTAIPEVDAAELLLVNPHFISAPYARKLMEKMTKKDYAPTIAEKDIFGVYKQLKWCKGNPIVVHENIVGWSSAELSCHGKGRH